MIQDTPSVVPRLATVLTGTLQELERHFPANQGELRIQAIRSAAGRLVPEYRGVLEPPAFAEPLSGPDDSKDLDECVNPSYAYSIVAKLATLAAAREQRRILEPLVSEIRTAGSPQ